MHKVISFFLIFIFAQLSWSADQPLQVWSRVQYSHHSQENVWGAQLQHRYNFESEILYEEQVNLSYLREIEKGHVAFLFTLGTVQGYEYLRELRYALEAEKSFKVGALTTYELRLRQEFRDFHFPVESFAYRFRIRNQGEWAPSSSSPWSISLNSEFNFYLNNYVPEARGFSSHRTILGLIKESGNYQWSLSYLHDYRDEISHIEIRHVILFGLDYDRISKK